MAKLKSVRISYGNSDDRLMFKIDVNINSEGQFTATWSARSFRTQDTDIGKIERDQIRNMSSAKKLRTAKQKINGNEAN